MGSGHGSQVFNQMVSSRKTRLTTSLVQVSDVDSPSNGTTCSDNGQDGSG